MELQKGECKLLIKEIKVIPVITDVSQKSQAFINWSINITFENNFIVLPDGSKIDGKIFMTNQLVFDNGQYTKALMNYYNATI